VTADVFVEGGVDGVLFGFEFAEFDGFGDEFVVECEIGGDGAPPLCKSLHNGEGGWQWCFGCFHFVLWLIC